MPDYLKEQKEAIRDAVTRLVESLAQKKGWRAASPGRQLGSNVAFNGGNNYGVQDFQTTGYDSMAKQTIVPFLIGFSTVDGTDVFSM